ncbi:MAG: aminotransferase class V-fold PLP-dependent enzyme [Bacteroidetes bacterium]|nr:aminotransferase class V-fold PLP-dependent enzyme [Bacteroidota bacterium]
MQHKLPPSSEFAHLWTIDPQVVYLNHGSFGACPRVILEKQQRYRQMLEKEPIQFLMKNIEGLLDNSREKVASFINANPEDIVFVQNATTGVNTVFRSLKFMQGDEIIYTNHIYGACKKTLEYISRQTGAKLVEAVYPFPIGSSEQIVQAVLEKVTPRTRIALIDHITSATALIHPVETIVKELDKRGIDTMIDGAHALGSIPLSLNEIGAAYYTANCHKWLCSPKGAAILHVRKDRQKEIVPVVISHAGYDAEPFTERFFWPGTWEPSAVLCVADAIDYMGSLLPGGWNAIMKRNRDLCLEARNLICGALEIDRPCPDSMVASMASFPVSVSRDEISHDYKSFDLLQERLFNEYGIEIPVWNWQEPGSRLTRISVQLYNCMEQYQYLTKALKD